jgi:biotin operon repressor
VEAQPGIELGKRPKIKQGEHRDLRKHATIPLRASTDPRMTAGVWRTLTQLCAYANRAGLLWVGLKRVGSDLKISPQAVHKHLAKLKAWGYVERVHHGFRNQKADTLRIIYDPAVTATDAVALASAIEDCRSPAMQDRDEYLRNFESEEPMPKRTKKAQPQSNRINLSRVEGSLKLTIEEVLSQNQVVTEADMLALERAIEAGLSRSRWLEGRAALPEASLRQVLAWCDGANERMPANTSESKG